MFTSFLDLVKARRSVRRYSDRPVARETIERCLEAARLAPSACNSQPWSFIVADREPLRGRLADAAFGGIYAMNAFARAAPALIVAITESSKYIASLAGRLRGIRYNLIDLGIACEHLVLQATAEGVGSCWFGWFDTRAVKRVLALPRGTQIDILIALGYPADDAPEAAPRKPLDAVRRYV